MSTRKQQVEALKEANRELKVKNKELKLKMEVSMERRDIAEMARMLMIFRNIDIKEALRLAEEAFKATNSYENNNEED